MTLAVLAIALKVLVPPGYMIAGPADGASFPLVLCTGHGPLTVDSAKLFGGADAGKKAPGEKSPHDSPCAFAGHGAAAPAPHAHVFETIAYVAYERALQPPIRRGIAPGRGLAAPPLPARGPPSLLT
jgi:hypothetical protein